MSVSFLTKWTQMFPPPGPINGANLPTQAGKVFVVTGGSHGLGFELSKVLYAAGGKVYVLTRSKERAEQAISRIQAIYDKDSTKKPGSLIFIHMDLEDFASVQSAAHEFLQREGPDGRLDVLFNNAGTGGRKDAPFIQGNEYHFTTNTLGPFLLARLLTPILSRTAEGSAPGSVRVVWPASLLVENGSPKGGVREEFIKDQESAKGMDYVELYGASKAAAWFVCSELSRRQPRGKGSVVYLAGNPGNYVTNMWKYTPWFLYIFLKPILNDPAVHGPETYLWMAFSDEVTVDDAVAGRYAMCNGRWHPGQRGDLVHALRPKGDNGSGWASTIYDWCETRVQSYLN
ncbi:hypothetical protein F4779DRAFT_576125 [Xylariaceae sp. FL0662B]|nr:hypothetical protein F4779DRAFT_576125 [Xylariaceae sp. FL0662B]